MEDIDDKYPTDQRAKVTCGTSKGRIVIEFYREWSPKGYDRVVNLFEMGFYDNSHFFRCMHGFLVQFGISYTEDEEIKKYSSKIIPDDPQLHPPIKFEEGIISYAGSGPNSRTSQIFIAYGAIPSLGRELWETPLGKITEGMEYVKEFYGGYGDNGPKQWKLQQKGIQYINAEFPLLDHFLLCSVKRTGMDEEEGILLDTNRADLPRPKEAIIPQKQANEHKQLLRSKELTDEWMIQNADGVITELHAHHQKIKIIPAGVLFFSLLFILFVIRNRSKSSGKKE